MQSELSKLSSMKKGSRIRNSPQSKVKRLKRSNQGPSDESSNNLNLESNSALGMQSMALGMQSMPQFSKVEALQVKVAPVQVTSLNKMSKIDQTIEKNHSNEILQAKQSQLKERHSPSNSVNKSNHSISYRSRLRLDRPGSEASIMEYDPFAEIKSFI